MTLLALIDGPASAFSFSIDLNTIMMALITLLFGGLIYFGKGWMDGVKGELALIHMDMKTHNDKSDAAHGNLHEKINDTKGRVSRIEGQLDIVNDEEE